MPIPTPRVTLHGDGFVSCRLVCIAFDSSATVEYDRVSVIISTVMMKMVISIHNRPTVHKIFYKGGFV